MSVVFFAMQTNDNKLRGAIGEKVYFKLHGDYFARTRPGSITPSQEELAVNVRLKMRTMGKLAKAVKYATPYGFVSRPKGESSSNAFVRVNYGCCSVADGVVSVDYERFVVHLKFLAQRLFQGRYAPDGDTGFQNLIARHYAADYECAQAIGQHIRETFDLNFPSSEQFFLTVHLHRLSVSMGLSTEEE